jgi:hypothetical protein
MRESLLTPTPACSAPEPILASMPTPGPGERRGVRTSSPLGRIIIPR